MNFEFLLGGLHNCAKQKLLLHTVFTTIYDDVGYLSAKKGVPMSKKKRGNGHHHLSLSDRVYFKENAHEKCDDDLPFLTMTL